MLLLGLWRKYECGLLDDEHSVFSRGSNVLGLSVLQFSVRFSMSCVHVRDCGVRRKSAAVIDVV